jgi:hypothetical protein
VVAPVQRSLPETPRRHVAHCHHHRRR